MPRIAKAAKQQDVDGYTLESFLLNIALLDLSENRLISDLLASISLRALRYVRLGLVADPDRIGTAIKSWRALQRTVARRDTEEVLQAAINRIEASRDVAVRATVAAPPPAPVSCKTASVPARSRPSARSRRTSTPRA